MGKGAWSWMEELEDVTWAQREPPRWRAVATIRTQAPEPNGRNADRFSEQARGKWMIPMYKAGLYTSFGCSMYMMVRLFLVSHAPNESTRCLADSMTRDTRPGSARTRFSIQDDYIQARPAWRYIFWQPNVQSMNRLYLSTFSMSGH
jgi:hypothetical protein